tara:strand:- start:63 stop:932 length:870 start_codon:yes stop_codon:yes gene_type:complete
MSDVKVTDQVFGAFDQMEGSLVQGIQETITKEVLPADFADRMQILGEYAMSPGEFQKYVSESDKYKWKSLHKPNMEAVNTENYDNMNTPIETIQSISDAMTARHLTFKNTDTFDVECKSNSDATSTKIINDEKNDLDKLQKYYSSHLASYKSIYNYQLSLGALIDGKLKELSKFSNKIDTYKQNLYIDGRKDNYENTNYDFYKSINNYLLIVYFILIMAYFIFTPFFQEKKYNNLKLVSLIILYIIFPFIIPSILNLFYLGYERLIEYNNLKGDIISYEYIIEDKEKYA